MYGIRQLFDDDIRMLVDIRVSQFRTRQILSQTQASIAETRKLLQEVEHLTAPFDGAPTEPPLASPREPE